MEHPALSQKSAQPHTPTESGASAASLAQAAVNAAQAAQDAAREATTVQATAGASPAGNAPHPALDSGPIDTPADTSCPLPDGAAQGAQAEVITPEVIPPDTTTAQAPGSPSEAAHPPLRRPGQSGDHGQGGYAHRPHDSTHSGGSFHYYSWGTFRGSSGGSGQAGQSGDMGGNMGSAFLMSAQTPMLITLALLIGVGAALGVLAAIGFGFFYLLGSAFAATANARRILSGKPLTPATVWVNRLLVWGAALFITVALARGL